MNAMLTSPRSVRAWLALGTIALLLPLSVHAGTPLICHPYEIGAAQSLPGTDGDWKGINPNYDRTHLVRDTLAILKADTPVIVRMETLRRAAIYATAGLRGWGTKDGIKAEDRANATQLMEKLKARLDQATGPARALALFDLGFYTETLRHTGVDESLHGYDLIVQAIQLRGSDGAMEFALALASSWPKHRAEQTEHLARARALASKDSLLASNLASHFSAN